MTAAVRVDAKEVTSPTRAPTGGGALPSILGRPSLGVLPMSWQCLRVVGAKLVDTAGLLAH